MFAFLKNRKSLRFGQIAIKKGLATEKDVQKALLIQAEYKNKHRIHKEIGAILTAKGILTPKDVEGILEEQKSREGLLAWFFELFNLSK
jgi:hypothetical protein